MQISHVLFLFISFHYLESAKCHVRHFAYYFVRAIVKQGSLFPVHQVHMWEYVQESTFSFLLGSSFVEISLLNTTCTLSLIS